MSILRSIASTVSSSSPVAKTSMALLSGFGMMRMALGSALPPPLLLPMPPSSGLEPVLEAPDDTGVPEPPEDELPRPPDPPLLPNPPLLPPRPPRPPDPPLLPRPPMPPEDEPPPRPPRPPDPPLLPPLPPRLEALLMVLPPAWPVARALGWAVTLLGVKASCST